jgi:MFS family permease
MNRLEAERKLHLDPNLHVIFAVTLMAIMGVANITPAFPRIARELGVTSRQVGYLITYFTFPGVILSPVLGVLADRLGRKKVLVPSLILFGVAGTACAFARNFDLLLALRFVQGVGAAAIGALNITIVGDLYVGKERTTAMGYNASVLSVGTASYPLIGGALATIGWNYPFFVSIIAIPVGFLVLFALDSPEPRNKQSLHTYFAEVWRAVRKRSIIGLLFCGSVSFIILYGSLLTYLPFLIAGRFHGSPFVIGLVLSASSISTAITASRLGSIAKRFPEKRILAASYLFYILALVLVPFAKSMGLLLVPVVIYGVAAGLNIPNVTSLMAAFAPIGNRAAIMSMNGMVLRLGQTLGPIIMAGVFGVWGFTGVYVAGAIFALGMFAVAGIIVRQPREDTCDHPPTTPTAAPNPRFRQGGIDA